MFSKELIFPQSFIIIKHGDCYIAVNGDAGHSIKLTDKEYAIFLEICDEYSSSTNKSDFMITISHNETTKKMLYKMIASVLVWFSKSYDKKQEFSYPRYVYWGLSDNCNLNCKYCYGRYGENMNELSLLNLADAKRIIDILSSAQTKTLYLTGGEPLLNPICFDICDYAVKKGIECSLITNGTLIDNTTIDRCKSFSHIKISIDSHIENINEKTRGMGTHDSIIRSIELVHNNDIELFLGTVVTKYNKDNLGEFITYMNTKYKISGHSFMQYSPTYNHKNEEMMCTVDDVIKYDTEITATYQRLTNKYNEGITPSSVYNPNKRICCGMGVEEIFLNPVGSVYPCRMTYSDDMYLGNILYDEYKKIISNASKIHEKISVDVLTCNKCDYKYLCGGACRAYHQGRTGSIFCNANDVCKISKYSINKHICAKHGICYTVSDDVHVLHPYESMKRGGEQNAYRRKPCKLL